MSAHPSSTDAYPLKWPAGWKRTPASHQKRAKFHAVSGPTAERSYATKVQVSTHQATQRILHALSQMRASRVVISTDIPLRQDGLPMSGRRAPDDQGVAVYWMLDGESQCMAIDIYDRIADNLAAVAATIDAMRAIERHGGAQILKRAFLGLKQLPASTAPVRTTEQAAELIAQYDDVLPATILLDRAVATDAIRAALNKTHPDKHRGNQELFLAVGECRRILEAHHGFKL